MLVLLPPSETKSVGGSGAPLDLGGLSHPELTGTRQQLAEALSTLADDVPASLDALGLSERQVEEVQRNAELWAAPTAPALERYTGVLYDALDVQSLSAIERKQADTRLAVASALFGIVRGTDSIPAYRLSGGSSLPGLGTLRSVWRPVLEPVLAAADDLVVDLRSGAYAALAKVPGAVEVRVLSEDATGKRKVVSHHNKAHKGKLARALAQFSDEPESIEDVLAVASDAGLQVEREADRKLCVVVQA
ncbi:peroxide stress protein YaaA [Saccharopolyspora sp. WRP15-2]|uniref:Peroxide stress protein YaaA n=1 Tax=Saccharopolyspora oryzae TaxID=2997343 RepID=A0ABT4USV1_9PSEU|nr:peroxide stress protein YaaA [Saccharopolyspora oryzae]MDA3624331.1 peroxide stress protein YaaA [Saccharopolyspora oryzae]